MAQKVRRTQEQRTAETRARLLDATIESLIEVGYAATTTRRVAELAGVSQGAQTHHFPYRVDLVTAAIARLAEQRIEVIERAVLRLPEDLGARIDPVLDGLWADYASDVFTVFVKVWVAAADDPELYERLVPIEREFSRSIGRLVGRLAAGEDVTADAEGRAATVLATMRGLALTYRFEPVAGDPPDRWPAVRAVLAEVLAGGIRR